MNLTKKSVNHVRVSQCFRYRKKILMRVAGVQSPLHKVSVSCVNLNTGKICWIGKGIEIEFIGSVITEDWL
jgi:hypothetical protein